MGAMGAIGPWARPLRVSKASGFVWLVGKTMENLWKRRYVMDEKNIFPIFDWQNGIVWFMEITLQSGFHAEKHWVDKRLPNFRALLFLSSSFVLSLLGERNDGGWKGQLSLLLRWACGLWLHPTLEQKPVPGSCISPMAQCYWCFSPSTPILLVDPWC